MTHSTDLHSTELESESVTASRNRFLANQARAARIARARQIFFAALFALTAAVSLVTFVASVAPPFALSLSAAFVGGALLSPLPLIVVGVLAALCALSALTLAVIFSKAAHSRQDVNYAAQLLARRFLCVSGPTSRASAQAQSKAVWHTGEKVATQLADTDLNGGPGQAQGYVGGASQVAEPVVIVDYFKR